MADETRNSVSGDAHLGALIQAGSVGDVHYHFGGDPAAGGPAGLPLGAPRQLPAQDPHFENRDAEIALVAEAAGRAREGARPLVVVVSGVAGIGKTALAEELAHRLSPHYPDGQLRQDLAERRSPDGTLDLSDLLDTLLHALRLPPGLRGRDHRVRLDTYRTHTSGRRLLLILDGVARADEAEQLLPASPHALVIVTSAHRQPALVRAGAVEIALGPLDDAHSTTLLGRYLDERRSGAESDAVAELIRFCSGLPLALRVTGERLAERELSTVARSVAELHREGLPVVEVVWDAEYRRLPEEAAELYRLLPAHPGGPYLCAEAAVALLGRGEHAAQDALAALLRAGLLEQGPADGRFRLAELPRRHAERCARLAGDPEALVRAERRVVRWYRRQAERSDRLRGARMRIAEQAPGNGGDGAPDVAFADVAEARHWAQRERHALYSAVTTALRAGADADGWALAEALWPHFMDHRPHVTAIEAFEAGVACATRDERPRAVVRLRCQLARALWETGEFRRATDALGPAASGAAALGDDKLLASVTEFEGGLLLARGDADGAASRFAASLQIHRAIGNEYGVLLQTHLLARAELARRQPRTALTLLLEAHGLAGEQGRSRMVGRTAQELGAVHRALGDRAEAGRWHRAALAVAEERGAVHDRTGAHLALAELAEESGDVTAAAEHRAVARELLAEAARGMEPA
ncbi:MULTISPECIES: AAA family ATPase [unclassified Streptomyces]|uniref:AAA family ATPase n=1 Tax=unclassified Streptomyces TaxID=2593676 RepID=UPI000CD54ADC|nr:MULTISPECIES: AAA family ATPase [unclassified Streptomyces]